MTLFEFPINEEIVRKVCASNNDLAIIITLIYIKEKAYKYYFDVVAELCERIKIKSTDPTELNREMICFSHWLLIYEMVKNDIFSIMDFPCVNSNRFFKTLLEKNVDFYDPSVAPALEQATGKSQKGNQENIVSDELFRLIELLTSEQNNIDKSTKNAIIESIDQIICGKTENWTY